MMTRAERRHRRERAVAYARKKLLEWGRQWQDRAPYWADNMAKCSCYHCTAPRRRTERRYTLQVETGE